MTQEEFFNLKKGDTVWRANRIFRNVAEFTVTKVSDGRVMASLSNNPTLPLCFSSFKAGELFKKKEDACKFQIQLLKSDIKTYRARIRGIEGDIELSESRIEALEQEMKQEMKQEEQEANND